MDVVPLVAYSSGGPNDPRTVFKELREQLTQVREEMTPWGWQAYVGEFRERQKAEKKLTALNTLPGSGAEPQDGVVRGTPMWQERLDKMLLVEHLKSKVMALHTCLSESTDLCLKCHAWLVKDGLLADAFVHYITHVPPSQHERIDVLQLKLSGVKKELEDHRAMYEEFLLDLQVKRDKYLVKVGENMKVASRRTLYDDMVVLWSYATQHEQAVRLREIRRVLEARVCALESSLAVALEEVEERGRQWAEEKAILTADRDDYKKKYQKMVKAHELAMKELESTSNTAEDRARKIQILATEKNRLSQRVEELEDDKARMSKQLADLRDEVAKLKEEIRKLARQLRDSEEVICDLRHKLADSEAVEAELEGQLEKAAVLEATLRDELLAARIEAAAAPQRLADLRSDLQEEVAIRRGVERERDYLLVDMRRLEAELARTVLECERSIAAIRTRAAQDLEDFITRELTAVREDFAKKTEALVKRNELLEREVSIGDALGPHLQVLNPLQMKEASQLCVSCRRAIIWEGEIKFPEEAPVD